MSEDRIVSVQIIRCENGYVLIGGGRNWAFRQLPEALEQAGRLLEPPPVVPQPSAGATS